ncbi:hypothetical protein FIU87_02295 [Bacillus sp. THAF10]|uniref:hypothetical protein n=1 Tax=Bacillus sp. THAF10 TaxID=2587848 RepID=UPI001269353B|nr:hypothetical protein [Bacillus sp. THAF10]QFT87469.1 hypothetical protein FIU87_02295 [Bacillus sp. THAF10]
MGRIAFLIISIALLAGCNMETKASEPTLQISSMSVGLGGNEDETVQYVRYSMVLTYNESLKIKEDTLEPLVAGWIEERMIDHEVETAEKLSKDQIKLEGKVTFDPTGLTKRDIITFEQIEDTIQGVIFETTTGENYQGVYINEETKLQRIGD